MSQNQDSTSLSLEQHPSRGTSCDSAARNSACSRGRSPPLEDTTELTKQNKKKLTRNTLGLQALVVCPNVRTSAPTNYADATKNKHRTDDIPTLCWTKQITVGVRTTPHGGQQHSGHAC